MLLAPASPIRGRVLLAPASPNPGQGASGSGQSNPGQGASGSGQSNPGQAASGSGQSNPGQAASGSGQQQQTQQQQQQQPLGPPPPPPPLTNAGQKALRTQILTLTTERDDCLREKGQLNKALLAAKSSGTANVAKLTQLNQQIADKDTEIATKQQRINEKTNELSALQASHQSLMTEQDTLKAKIKTLEAQLNVPQSGNPIANNTQLDALRKEITRVRGELSKKNQALLDKQYEHDVKISQKEKAHAAEIKTLKAELETAKKNNRFVEATRLQKELDECTKKNAQLKSDATADWETAQGLVKTAEAAQKTAETEKNALEQRKKTLESEKNVLETEKNALKQRESELEAQLSVQTAALTNLTANEQLGQQQLKLDLEKCQKDKKTIEGKLERKAEALRTARGQLKASEQKAKLAEEGIMGMAAEVQILFEQQEKKLYEYWAKQFSDVYNEHMEKNGQFFEKFVNDRLQKAFDTNLVEEQKRYQLEVTQLETTYTARWVKLYEKQAQDELVEKVAKEKLNQTNDPDEQAAIEKEKEEAKKKLAEDKETRKTEFIKKGKVLGTRKRKEREAWFKQKKSKKDNSKPMQVDITPARKPKPSPSLGPLKSFLKKKRKNDTTQMAKYIQEPDETIGYTTEAMKKLLPRLYEWYEEHKDTMSKDREKPSTEQLQERINKRSSTTLKQQIEERKILDKEVQTVTTEFDIAKADIKKGKAMELEFLQQFYWSLGDEAYLEEGKYSKNYPKKLDDEDITPTFVETFLKEKDEMDIFVDESNKFLLIAVKLKKKPEKLTVQKGTKVNFVMIDTFLRVKGDVDKKYAKNFVDSVLSMYSFKTKGSNIAILEPAPGQETIVQDFDRTKLTRYYRKSHGFEEIDNQDYEVSSGAGSQAQSTSQPNGLFAPARIESYEGVPGLIAALPKLRIPARHEL